MDTIDEVLNGLKLQSTVFSRLELGPGWGFAKEQLDGAPFHIVIEGEAWVGAADGDDFVRFAPGDMVILPRGQPHRLLSSPNATAVPFRQVMTDVGLQHWTPGQRVKPVVLRVGPRGQPCSRLISGIFEFNDRRRNPLLAALPDLLIMRACGDPATAGGRLADIGAMISREIEAGQPGAGLVAGRLADYLFIQAVRAHLVANADDKPGWLRGLRDPFVGAALARIHSRPDRDWTVENLARDVNMSRSQFAQRFKLHVGRGPIEYLTSWRMFAAAGHLAEGRLALKEVAELAGYDSVAAFGKAFKRWGGQSPAAAKRSAREMRGVPAARRNDARADGTARPAINGHAVANH